MAKEKLTIDKSPTEVRGSQAAGKHVEIEATDGDVVYVAAAPAGRKSQLKGTTTLTTSAWLSSKGESVVTVTTKKK
jgi:hypothetical protein